MSRARVACVGTGFIAGRHLAALTAMPDVEVVAVADVDESRARAVADRVGARSYGDALTMLTSEDLDAVWLCVPPFAHGPLEGAALDRGLPFFVEKPLALDLDTAADISAQVHARGLVTGVGYHWRALSLVARAQQALDGAGVQLALGSWLDRTPAPPWWSRRSGSGGQLIEQATHLFDLARALLGEVDTVSALEVTPAVNPEGRDVPLASSVLLGFTGGAVGTISSTSILDRRHAAGLRLVADQRLVDLTERSLSDHELRVAGPDGDEVVTSDEDPIAAEDRAFLAAVRGEAPTALVPYDEALRTHAVVCAADRSARTGGTAMSPAQCLAAAGGAPPRPRAEDRRG